jgi:hypothetical protein
MPIASLLPSLILAAAAAAGPAPGPSPAAAVEGAPVILFLVDNSASLPPLDPEEKRVAALERMFTFLQGQPYRLILFGGRQEVYVDDVSRYRNDGQWTDFYYAFERARTLMASYPPETRFRLVLLTDGVLDPRPADWSETGLQGEALRRQVAARTLDLLRQLKAPLYVILVGQLPDRTDLVTSELAPPLILEMAQVANGDGASAGAQSLAAFFNDDGVLLKKFIYRVAPYEGLRKIERAVTRIVAPARPFVELQFLGGLVLPLLLLVFLMLGVLVRSFPGKGDREIVEVGTGAPAHLAVDRIHRVEGGLATTGLSLVAAAKDAAATLSYERPVLDLTGIGLDTDGLDQQTRHLLGLPLDELARALKAAAEGGAKEEMIYALNLEHMARSFDSAQAERLLKSAPADRRSISPLDFLRAKAHLLGNEALRRKLVDARVQLTGYGAAAGTRVELVPGARVRLARYGFLVKAVERGGRKDVRVVLAYDRVPSLLGLKTWLPAGFQRLFRLRRTSERVVA